MMTATKKNTTDRATTLLQILDCWRETGGDARREPGGVQFGRLQRHLKLQTAL